MRPSCFGAHPNSGEAPRDRQNPEHGWITWAHSACAHTRHFHPAHPPSAPRGGDSLTGLWLGGALPGLGRRDCLAQLCLPGLLLGPLSLLLSPALCSQLRFALAPRGFLAVTGAISRGGRGCGLSSCCGGGTGSLCPASPGDAAQCEGQSAAGRALWALGGLHAPGTAQLSRHRGSPALPWAGDWLSVNAAVRGHGVGLHPPEDTAGPGPRARPGAAPLGARRGRRRSPRGCPASGGAHSSADSADGPFSLLFFFFCCFFSFRSCSFSSRESSGACEHTPSGGPDPGRRLLSHASPGPAHLRSRRHRRSSLRVPT